MEKTLSLCKKLFVSVIYKFKKEKRQKAPEVYLNYNHEAFESMSLEELQLRCYDLENKLEEEKRINNVYQMIDEARRKMNNMWQDLMDRVTHYIEMDISTANAYNWDMLPINDGGGDRICEYEMPPAQPVHKKPIKHRPTPAAILKQKYFKANESSDDMEKHKLHIAKLI